MIMRVSIAAVIGLFSITNLSVSGLSLNHIFRSTRQGTALGYANERMPHLEKSLVGQIVNNRYRLSNEIQVASPKCEIYEAFHLDDVTRKHPVIVKMSYATEAIDLEHRNFMAVTDNISRDKRDLFVQIYDKVKPSHGTLGKSAIVMEKGEDNLRFIIGRNGAYRGESLRKGMETVIKTVNVLHELDMVWTETKAENFVVQKNGSIKAIDLESLTGNRDFLKMYTAEAVPPEFPVSEINKCLPPMRVEKSFDMWGLGMTLLEMATGKPFFADGLTDLEYIKSRLGNHRLLAKEIDTKLLSVDPKARSVIKKCLAIDPRKRSSCRELLQDSYFMARSPGNQQGQAGSPSSNFGAPESRRRPEAHSRQQRSTVSQNTDTVAHSTLKKILEQSIREHGANSTFQERLKTVLQSINIVGFQQPKLANAMLRILDRMR